MGCKDDKVSMLHHKTDGDSVACSACVKSRRVCLRKVEEEMVLFPVVRNGPWRL
jgi:hypothetical protein